MTQQEVEQMSDEFVCKLEELAERDRAGMARLKRCAGRPLEECTAVFPLFYRMLPADARGCASLEEAFMLIASLFPLMPGRSAGDLGASMKAAATANTDSRAGIDRRMAVLLDCPREGLSFRLRQAVALLSSHEVGIDWRRLLVDVVNWEVPWRRVQKEWARTYFGENV